MNKYILRLLVLLIVGIIIFIANKFKFKKNLKDKSLRFIIYVVLLFVVIVPYDSLFFKFKTVDKFFDYYYPQAEIIKSYEYDDKALVLYIDDSYSSISLKKNKDYYKKNIVWNINVVNYGDSIVDVIEEDGVLVIIVYNFLGDNKVNDSLNTNFERIVHNGNYIYVGIIDKEYDKNYKLIINGKDHEILKDK